MYNKLKEAMAAFSRSSLSSFYPSFSGYSCQTEGRKSFACQNIRGSFTIQDRKIFFWKKLQKGVNGSESRKSTALKKKMNISTKAIRDDISDIALGPNGTYHILFTDGSQNFRGLPTDLYIKLMSRIPILPGVSFVSLGPQGEYFVKFEDGHCHWGGPRAPQFDLAVKYYDFNVESVSFGPDKTWFVRSCFGDADTNGLPQPHRNRIASLERNGHGIDCVSLGSNGDWWMKFDTGHSRFCTTDEDIRNRLRNGDENDKVVFGCNEEFAVIRDFSVDYWRVNDWFDESIEYKSSNLESEDLVYLDLQSIRYTQESINSNFGGNRGTIYDLHSALVNGSKCAEDLPYIRVVIYAGDYWSLDNRRLLAYKNAYEGCVPVKIVSQGPEFFRKLTTSSGGLYIHVI